MDGKESRDLDDNRKTCAILTISDDGNYGNRLQNYALEKIISGSMDVSTIRMFLRTNSLIKYRLLTALLPLYVNKNILKTVSTRSWKAKRKRVANFRTFSKKNATEKYYLSVIAGFDSVVHCKDPEVIVIGSDQVWNYTWLSLKELELRLGMFTSPERLVSYAASIGVDEIDIGRRSIFKEGWVRIPHISVREDRASELVKAISGKEAPVVLDPTLLLSKREWEKVCKGFVPQQDRYILTYFLGRPSASQEQIISRVSDALGARVRRINDLRDLETYTAGPAEFVELIAKARYIFTDSYHACCFSILFNKPFKVFNRMGFDGKASMNSRMKTLFRLFELEDCMDDDEALPDLDWIRINQLLIAHRKESLYWLYNALGVSKDG